MLKKLWIVYVAAAVLFLAPDAVAAVCMEHIALDVAAPETIAKWWCEDLGETSTGLSLLAQSLFHG